MDKMKDNVIGELTSGVSSWSKPFKIHLFGKTFKTKLKFEAYAAHPIDDVQRRNYVNFTSNIFRYQAEIEKQLLKYGKQNNSSEVTDKDARKATTSVGSIVFYHGSAVPSVAGHVVVEIGSVWEDEHGIGVQIMPSIKVGVLDEFI